MVTGAIKHFHWYQTFSFEICLFSSKITHLQKSYINWLDAIRLGRNGADTDSTVGNK